MESEERELPLFPLGAVVLFPGMPLPLQVFEERYKQMVADLERGDPRFGVVLIKEGKEVGEPAVPHSVGTIARIVQLNRVEDGRIFLSALGQRRFRIRETLREQPYIVANVELLEEEEAAEVPEEVAHVAHSAFEEYVRNLTALRGGWIQGLASFPDPVMLSYTIAQDLQMEPLMKQRLLEVATATERLQMETSLLERGIQQLKERMEREGPQKRFSRN